VLRHEPHRFLAEHREEEMSHRLFDEPIYLRLPDGHRYSAWNVWEALDFIERFWTGERDASVRRAKKLCENALDGWTTAAKARAAVVEAARRAGLLATSDAAAERRAGGGRRDAAQASDQGATL
jgi:hypothetical protein